MRLPYQGKLPGVSQLAIYFAGGNSFVLALLVGTQRFASLPGFFSM